MSKGSQIINFRLEDAEIVRVQRQIARRNLHTANEPWNLSDFIRQAITEKLAHMERSRRPKSRKKKEVVYEG